MQQILQPALIQPNLASPQFKANPHPFYARLRSEAPIYRARLSRHDTRWLVTRYSDVAMVLKDDRFGKDRFKYLTDEQQAKLPWMPALVRPLARNMLDLDAPDHTRVRGLVHKAFTPRLIEQLRERIQTLCDELLAAAQRRGSVDLIRDYALPLPLTIIAEMLGIPMQDRQKFQHWSASIVSVATSTDVLRAVPGLWLFMRYLRKLFKQRRSHPRDDLVTALVQAEEAGDTFSEDELLAMVFLLLIAGHETTVNLIASGMLTLIQHPEQMERLKNDPALIKPAIEELLRYTSPVDMATERYAREDVTIGGVTIPRGEQVLAVIGSANRDEEQFYNPDTLDLTREPNRHLAFGFGIHYCLGAPLARLEGQIAINTLLHRMPNIRLASSPEALQWRRGIFLRGLKALPMVF